MHTADECRSIAKVKLEQVKRDSRRRKSLIAAAEAWLLLAIRMGELEEQAKDRPS